MPETVAFVDTRRANATENYPVDRSHCAPCRAFQYLFGVRHKRTFNLPNRMRLDLAS